MAAAADLQSLMSTSMMSSLRTGNVIMDVFLACIVATLMGAIFSGLKRHLSYFTNFSKRYLFKWFSSPNYKMTITYRQKISIGSGKNIYDEGYDRNNELYNAITEYIAEQHPDKFTQIERVQGNVSDSNNNTYLEHKTKHILYKVTDPQFEITFRNSVIFVDIWNQSSSEEGIHTNNKMITLETKASLQLLKEWTDSCYNYYIDKHYKQYDTSSDSQLFYFDLNRVGEKVDDPEVEVEYLKYDLKTDRSFDQLFFDRKEDFLQLLDDFRNKQGIFSRKTVPNRLNILLHGEPGTGKTSLIKALANLTRRHVLNINPSIIENNRQLTDIFFGPYIVTPNTNIHIKPAERLYIIEDIDATTSVIKSRTNDLDSNSDTDQPTEADPKIRKNLIQPQAPVLSSKPSFTLSGFLNNLDGVLELRDTIVIITTNHPEMLDPALIRSGRINMSLCLGKMTAESVQQLLKYHYQEEVELEKLEKLRLGGQYTPSKLEEIIMISKTLDDFWKHIPSQQ